ncbi:site-specific integrase [Candidatus Bathyarchaeota archaeon]|nr:site-specific integrase [Candidatus Bathyarchaeota archaeon]
MGMVVDFRTLQNDVLSFAKESGVLKGIADPAVKHEFLLWMYMLGLIKRRTPIDVEVFVEDHKTEFLDWFLFVHEHRDGKTIGQIYAEKNRLDDVREEAAEIKEGVGLFLVEIEGVDTDGLKVLDLTSGEKLFVRDKTLPSQAKLGEGLLTILYPYAGEYYISGGKATRVEIGEMAKAKRKIGFIEEFENMVNEFIDHSEKKGISEKTLRKRYEALSLFTEFLSEEPITNINEIKLSHIRKFMKWSKRALPYYGITTREEHLAALKKFFRYLHEKGYSTADVIGRHIL